MLSEIRVLLLALAAAALPAQAADYVQAEGSTLEFSSSYDGEAFSGRFGGFDTRLSFDPARLQDARLEVSIRMPGTDTGNADRDDTLAGGDFFAVAEFAEARYRAITFRALGGNRYAADGELSLRGVNKPVTLEFTWTPGAMPVLAGEATVRRLDFGVGAGDWADTEALPDDVAIRTRVILKPAP
jgi:polyisoprenoid-binding protein YceI